MTFSALPVGLVLAGGQSRRMGGTDKALLPFAGKRLIDHVVQRAQSQVSRLVINSPNSALDSLGWERLTDVRSDFQGPLAGIEAGLLNLAADEQWLATFPCDAPFVPTDFVQRLTNKARASDSQVVLAQSNGRTHPVAGLWQKSVLGDLQLFLASGERKMDIFTGLCRESRVNFDLNGAIDPFLNLNRPRDLAAAEALLAS